MSKGEASHAPGVVERLAQWALAVRAEEIPQTAVGQAKLLLLDSISCAFSALAEDTARATVAVVEAALTLDKSASCTQLMHAVAAPAA